MIRSPWIWEITQKENIRLRELWIPPSKTSNNHRIYVSLPCAIALTGDEESLLDATVNLNQAVNMTFPQAEETAAALGEKAGLTQEQIKVSEAFFNQAGISRLTVNSVAALALVAILILAAAGLVIHNIFYIAVAGKVREYGQMRTLGMTRNRSGPWCPGRGLHWLQRAYLWDLSSELLWDMC